jgi:hypothetical protein
VKSCGPRERTELLHSEAESILNEAKRAKDLRTALAAIREAANVTREPRGTLQILGQLTGELSSAHGTDQVMAVVPAMPSLPNTPVIDGPIIDVLPRSYRASAQADKS